MEFLLGNPYSTPVGQCIERATDGGLQNEDWTLNMEICDIINETEEGPKDAMRALKKRLSGNKNYREVMLALTAWADAFRSSPDLTGVVHIYEELKRKGIEFPMADLDALSPIHTPQRGTPEVDPAMIKYLAPASPAAGTPKPSPSPPSVTQEPQMPSPITATPEQIARLRSELDVVRGNTKVMSEMLTEMVPGQEDPSDLELLQELNRTCRAMQQRVVELISRVSNEEVTEELLHVNDDLNNIFLRYERYERYRSGRAAQNNGVSTLNEATEDNLIDLGPGSPAVVTPRITSNVASDSVSGTLSSLPGRNQDDFDMFAHTRSSSLADQRKNVKYEDPQALGGLVSALDVRQQNTGGIPVSQSSVMDDIEEWLCADVKGDAAEEGVTSEEFDKFLEERAKVADTLPSPPGANPAHPARAPSSSQKKAERTEDALFAL
uniref:Target of myb1 like 2 membrane trafficking protein n=1 Tax=Sparus aurata TaxID=8175 RepID=A0A671XTV7_SPAAU